MCSLMISWVDRGARMPRRPAIEIVLHVTVSLMVCASVALAQRVPPVFNPLAARVDPYVAKPRVGVRTDIANEPDDQMSMVRFLLYSNQLDVEGLIATTSTW